MSKYDDILHMPHHVSSVHPHMSVSDRAAQFAPFSALTGYEEVIDEAGRLTDVRAEADESRLAELDERLREVMEHGGEVSIVYFVEDVRKQGGSYHTVTGNIRRVDGVFRRIVMADGCVIEMENIVDLS